MKIAIIGAMEEEVKLISEMLEEKEAKLINGYTFEVGKLFGKDIILTVSSIGKVATGLLMGTLFSNFKDVDKVINVGIAGGVMGKVKPGDVVVSEKLCYSDADAKTAAAKVVAIPGTSDHNLGLAVDLDSVETTYENTPQFKWLKEHCTEYGFVLRYPKDKSEITGIIYEPWHYRFVGVKAAKEMVDKNMCLEEYVEYLKTK